MLTHKSHTPVLTEFQTEPSQYKHLFIAMNKMLENKSKGILVTNMTLNSDMTPLICFVFS